MKFLFLILFCPLLYGVYSSPDSCGVPMDEKLLRLFNFEGGVFIEAGANNGIAQSNTKLLEEKLGWKGILVEPSPSLYPALCANRPGSLCFSCALGSFEEEGSFAKGDFDGHLMGSLEGARLNRNPTETIPIRSIQSLLDEAFIRHVHLFSLDTEGHELQILKGIDFSKTTFDYFLIEIYQRQFNGIVSFLSENGYELIECFSNYSFETNPGWDGTHNDYLFKRKTLPHACSELGLDFLRAPAKKDRRPSPPYITGDGFRAACDFILDEEFPQLPIERISGGSSIFVGTHFLELFFFVYRPAIQGKYVLVTHNSDHPAPGLCAALLEDEKLIAWFAENVEDMVHPKLIPIPIGLENRYNPNGRDLSFIGEMRDRFARSERPYLLYMNFLPREKSDRAHVFDLFKDAPYCKVSSGAAYIDYLADMGRSQFVLSPRGNGVDCLRTWESLCMGSIPVVKKSACDWMYQDLPVLLVDRWEDLNEEFLLRSLQEIRQKEIRIEKLFLPYWLNLIETAKKTGEAPSKR